MKFSLSIISIVYLIEVFANIILKWRIEIKIYQENLGGKTF